MKLIFNYLKIFKLQLMTFLDSFTVADIVIVKLQLLTYLDSTMDEVVFLTFSFF